jgi:hypothetical protein
MSPHRSFLGLLLCLIAVLPRCGKVKPMTDNGHSNNDIEQALIITIPLSDGANGTHEEQQHLFKLEDELMKAIEQSGAGEYDGNEIGGGTFTIYAYGSSAEGLFNAAWPVLGRYDLPQGSRAVKRYGKPGAKQDLVSIGKGAKN